MPKKTHYVDQRNEFADPHQITSPWKWQQLNRYPSEMTRQQVLADRQVNAQAVSFAAQAYEQQLNQEYQRTVTRLKQMAGGGLYSMPGAKITPLDFSKRLKQTTTLINMLRDRDYF